MWLALWEFGSNEALSRGVYSAIFSCPYCKSKDSVIRKSTLSAPLEPGIQALIGGPREREVEMICRICKRPQPHLEVRAYGQSLQDIERRIRMEQYLHDVWGPRKPLWTIS